MTYQFTPDLATGNNSIDSQHKELFQAINSLMAACSQGKGRAELEKTAKFLYDYTTIHFADEEKLQVQYAYPEYIKHRQYHEAFKKVVKDLMQKLQAQGPNLVLVGEINTAVAGWLVNHIKVEDKKLAAHIQSKAK